MDALKKNKQNNQRLCFSHESLQNPHPSRLSHPAPGTAPPGAAESGSGFRRQHKSQYDSPKVPRDTLKRRNSTGTIYLMDTLASPDESTIVSCTSYALHRLIKERPPKACLSKSTLVNLDAFDERCVPLSADFDPRVEKKPSLRCVFSFISELMDNQSLSCEVAVMACAFVSRFLRSTSLHAMHCFTWRKIILSALLVSDKVWEDSAVWNADYKKTFPSLSLDELNALERNFLIALEFNLTLKASTYALYYFEIRSVSDRRSSNLKPLDLYTAKKLEARSRGAEEVVKMQMHQERVKSDNYTPQALPRISLEQFRKSYLDQYTIF